MAGLAVLLFGALPRLSVTLAWAAPAAAIALGPLGDVIGLPGSVRDLSPFSHAPAVTAAAVTAAGVTAGPIVALAAIAAALTAAGLLLFRRRDLTP
ncbi:hypothetical protein [Sphaerisporangium sp. TRM90804]|uniref:hypothetical protein n=1 Tax=Sphaerisporangium sp. TRM90804 TaxID=3031113 RepID=UPI0024492DA5|nr:hypothetical protein [Sphaerisporangium sp. TRM90804]MDH2425892.1 hypothetical protein [Sphaerisporangium sp. TRM90804]